MGMYTELVFKADIKPDLPADVESVLRHLFNGETLQSLLPDHEFFKCSRWRSLGCGNSYYHIPWASSSYSEGYIFSRSDLKNYDDEIEKFIDWVTPYLFASGRTCVGWSWYEEDDEPTLIFVEVT